MPATLSVVLCNYNDASHLPDALERLLDQSLRPTEVIVIDDGSTDDSASVLQTFARRPGVRVVYNGTNRGVVLSANLGLSVATSDYVYFAAADDRALPGLFEMSMDVLRRYPDAALCCSQPGSIGETGAIHPGTVRITDVARYFAPPEVATLLRERRLWLAGHTSLVRRAPLAAAGGLLPALRWHCDWLAMHTIAFRHGVCFVPETLAAMRCRPNSYSASGMREPSAQDAVLREVLAQLQSRAYADVRSLFLRSNVLRQLPRADRALGRDPRYWPYLATETMRDTVWPTLSRRARRLAPTALKRAYRALHGTAAR